MNSCKMSIQIMKRDSNIELLRIVAMILVLLVHANYFSLGSVDLSDITNYPIESFLKAFAEQLCIICVNVFILISGWFGIRPSLKGALSLLFQVFFFHILIVIVAFFCGEDISLDILFGCFYFGKPYWFVPAYLVLYSVSPILNAFISSVPPKIYMSVLLAFFVLEFAFGWATNIAAFNGGYSAMSFIGLYLLAGFIRNYSIRILNISIYANLLCYLICSVLPVLLLFVTKRNFNMLAYLSPFVVVSSVAFFLAFKKIKISSVVINYLACSSFSIYLVHQHPIVYDYFIKLMNHMCFTLGGYCYTLVVIILAPVFALLCMLLDKPRIIIWNWLCRVLLDRILAKFNFLMDRLYSSLGD